MYICCTILVLFEMIRFKPVIRKNQTHQDGTVNIKIRVTHNAEAGYLPTKFNVQASDFDEKNGRVTVPSLYQDQSSDINLELLSEMGSYAAKIKSKNDQVQYMTLKSLISLLREEGDPSDIFTILNSRIKQMDQIGNINYRDCFKGTKSMLSDFNGGVESIPLSLITPDWLNRLERHLKTEAPDDPDKKFRNMSPNSIGIHMRNIRTCFNDAITSGNADLTAYPFRRYRIPKSKTRKRNLTTAEMNAIVSAEIKEPLMAWARDMYVLSFYLIGINMKDLFYLKTIEEGRIYYKRSKGKKDYSIKVHPAALKIINQYPGKKYLLDTLDNYSDYRSATKRINYKLKDIADVLKIKKEISTYYARHSWATIASSLGVPEDVIAYALGHTISNEMTTIYIDYDLKKVDAANKKLIKYVTELTSE